MTVPFAGSGFQKRFFGQAGIQNFNIGIQRALASNLTLGLVYSGSVSHHLAQASAGGRSIFTNQINPKYLALGNLLRSPANAANGCSSGAWTRRTTASPAPARSTTASSAPSIQAR